jgi:hypothetical protein
LIKRKDPKKRKPEQPAALSEDHLILIRGTKVPGTKWQVAGAPVEAQSTF